MTMIAFDLPDGAFAALRKDPREMESELRMAAAAKWYELGMISQERGAEIAGLTRVELMRALSRLGVSPFQEDLDEDELADGRARGGQCVADPEKQRKIQDPVTLWSQRSRFLLFGDTSLRCTATRYI